MSSYWEHKKWSMAMTAVTCGVGAYLSRGTKLSRIGYKVAGPVRAEGGKKVAQMVGGELVQHLTRETIAKETLKRVGCKLIEGAAYGLAQGAVDHVSFGICFIYLSSDKLTSAYLRNTFLHSILLYVNFCHH